MQVSVRKISPAALNNFKREVVFQYEYVNEPARSIWDRFQDWFWSKISEMLSSESNRTILNTALIVLSATILLFFVIKLIGMKNGGLFGKKNRGGMLDYSVTDENIHTLNFDSAIEEATNNGNFRLAVRLFYLQCLKNLADHRLINWQVDKTNITYVQELKGNPLQHHFRQLTYQFENAWYGDLPVKEIEFLAVKDQFIAFNRQLN